MALNRRFPSAPRGCYVARCGRRRRRARTRGSLIRILTPAGLGELARFVRPTTLVAFDFDGTLAAIVRTPETAALRVTTRELLGELCEHIPCAVISGRTADDIGPRVAGLSLAYVLANHGLSFDPRVSEFPRLLDDARASLADLCAKIEGAQLEDKHLSLAIHYRRAPESREARRAIERGLVGLRDQIRVIPGKAVFEILPAAAMDKSSALLRLRTALGAARLIFVGDDSTDEDVFAIDRPDEVLTIRVGPSRRSAAKYYLRDQREIDTLLRVILDLRAHTRS